MSKRFKQLRAANPNTLTFTAGDSMGGSQLISSSFEDKPAVIGLRLLGVDADTLG